MTRRTNIYYLEEIFFASNHNLVSFVVLFLSLFIFWGHVNFCACQGVGVEVHVPPMIPLCLFLTYSYLLEYIEAICGLPWVIHLSASINKCSVPCSPCLCLFFLCHCLSTTFNQHGLQQGEGTKALQHLQSVCVYVDLDVLNFSILLQVLTYAGIYVLYFCMPLEIFYGRADLRSIPCTWFLRGL